MGSFEWLLTGFGAAILLAIWAVYVRLDNKIDRVAKDASMARHVIRTESQTMVGGLDNDMDDIKRRVTILEQARRR